MSAHVDATLSPGSQETVFVVFAQMMRCRINVEMEVRTLKNDLSKLENSLDRFEAQVRDAQDQNEEQASAPAAPSNAMDDTMDKENEESRLLAPATSNGTAMSHCAYHKISKSAITCDQESVRSNGTSNKTLLRAQVPLAGISAAIAGFSRSRQLYQRPSGTTLHNTHEDPAQSFAYGERSNTSNTAAQGPHADSTTSTKMTSASTKSTRCTDVKAACVNGNAAAEIKAKVEYADLEEQALDSDASSDWWTQRPIKRATGPFSKRSERRASRFQSNLDLSPSRRTATPPPSLSPSPPPPPSSSSPSKVLVPQRTSARANGTTGEANALEHLLYPLEGAEADDEAEQPLGSSCTNLETSSCHYANRPHPHRRCITGWEHIDFDDGDDDRLTEWPFLGSLWRSEARARDGGGDATWNWDWEFGL